VITRRNALKLGALTTGGLALSSLSIARATGDGTRLVVVFASGGWDTTTLFDPKPDSNDVDTADGDWASYGALDLWRTDGTPAAHDFFTRWGSMAAVVNGIATESLVHEECGKRVLTGSNRGGAPDIAALVAAAHGGDCPLPYLVRGASARTGTVEALSGQLGWTNQLSAVAVPDLHYPAVGSTEANPGFQPRPDEDVAVRAYLEASAARLSGRAASIPDSERLADYLESLDRSHAIRDAAQTGFLSDIDLVQNIEEPWPHTVAALAEGFSQCVFIEDDGYWDTHFQNADQVGLHNTLFGGLDTLMRGLEDEGLLDETVVLVLSEMGRTPVLNAGQGKDHWPFTSALVLGTDVRSGVVQGTDGDLRPTAVDLSTGRPGAGGRLLHTSDVLATVAELTGLDAATAYPQGEVIDALLG